MLKYCYLFHILLFVCVNTYSQNPVQVFTPNAVSLGQYGQIPVNYFNGLPDISIPITTFKGKGFELPIKLSYHASGINPDLHPGWVGLGWTLHAGGMISRIVKGYKDEKSEAEFQYLSDKGYGNEQFAYYYHAEQLQQKEWSDEKNLAEINDYSASVRPLGTEPDEFQVNLDDIQASFYIVGKNKIKIKSKTDATFKVDIKLNTSNSSLILYQNSNNRRKNLKSKLFTYISEIIITKNDGTKYYFGGDLSAIEFSCVQYPTYVRDNTINTNEWKSIATANTWMLKKVALTNGEEIEFKYAKNGTPIVMLDNHYGEAYLLEENQQIYSIFDTKDRSSKYFNISFTFIQPSYLQSIKSITTNNEIYFNSSKTNELKYNITPSVFNYRVGDFYYYDNENPGEFSFDNLMNQNYYMQLDEIVEKNKHTVFHYSNDSLSRLRLLSVNILQNDRKDLCKYILSYNNLKLPPYNAKKSDRWGYYNNKYYGNTEYEKLREYRTADEKHMQAELLTSITYPTGGRSEFIYEPHQYSHIAEQFEFAIKPSSGMAGGVRIKEIKTIENGKTNSRLFEYKDSLGQSSGILSGNHLYYVTGRQHIQYHYGHWWGLVYENIKVDYKARYYFMRENSFNQLSTTNGNHVTYSRIIEKQSDGSQTIYSYSNHEHYMDESPVKMIDNINDEVLTNSFVSKELERGLLLKTEFINNVGIPVKTEIYQYNSSPERYNDFVKSVNQMVLIGGNVRRISALKLYTFYPYLESKISIEKDPSSGREIKTKTSYEYNNNRLISKITTTNSKGEKEYKVFTYTGDLNSILYQRMQDLNMISLPVESILIRDNHVIHSELVTYTKNEANRDYVPAKFYKASIKNPVAIEHFLKYDGVTKDCHYIVPHMEYTRFDNHSNITEFLTDNIYYTCFWGYNKDYPIGIFENARNNYQVTEQYENERKSVYVKLDPININQNRQIYEFKTSQSGIVEIVLPGAMFYNWYMAGRVDGHSFDLVAIRSNDRLEFPWNEYQARYNGTVEINVPEGNHRLYIETTNVHKGSESDDDSYGEFFYSYWSTKKIDPIISGYNEAFYETFENNYSYNIVPFGFHSCKSYSGEYTVKLPTNPNKRYTIDYQVYKNGKWNYKKDEFNEGHYLISEGNNPIDEIRVYPTDASVNTYTYLPFIGLRSQTNTRGITESYKYDILGRLMSIHDNDNRIIKSYKYKYYNQSPEDIPQTYYSIEQKKTYTKNDCDSIHGELGTSIEYIVPKGKYTSIISQEDANLKAYNDVINNGQQYANEHADCSQNIVVSVYNPHNTTCYLECTWGPQGSITRDFYPIPPSEKTAETGDILTDYKPAKVYIPRRNYRTIIAYTDNNYSNNTPLSIKSSQNGFELLYTKEHYPDFKDTYVIGNYSFSE